MSNWDMFHLNTPDPQEAVQKHRDAHHGEGRHAPVTLERALIYLAIVAGISAVPVIILLMLGSSAG